MEALYSKEDEIETPLETMESLGKFIDIIRLRQQIVESGLKKEFGEEELSEIDKKLSKFSNYLDIYKIKELAHNERIRYINYMSIDNLIKWVEFFRYPRFLREFAERVNLLIP